MCSLTIDISSSTADYDHRQASSFALRLIPSILPCCPDKLQPALYDSSYTIAPNIRKYCSRVRYTYSLPPSWRPGHVGLWSAAQL